MPTKDAPETPVQQYVVLHTAVDAYYKGQIITIDHLNNGYDRDVDIDRLKRLGAIAPVDSIAGKYALESIEPGAETPDGQIVTDPVKLPDSKIAATTPA